jgi:hypothetical protein
MMRPGYTLVAEVPAPWARSLLVSGPVGPHENISVQFQDLYVFPSLALLIDTRRGWFFFKLVSTYYTLNHLRLHYSHRD